MTPSPGDLVGARWDAPRRQTPLAVSGTNSKQGYADPGRVVPTGSPKSLLLIPERYRIRCTDELGLSARSVIIWKKSNPVPESARDRVSRVHEDWVHLTRSQDYYSDVAGLHTGTRWPGSVWETRTGAGEMGKPPADLAAPHYAPFPLQWPYRIIRAWCPEGGTVLDPFGGTGTTVVAARLLRRQAHYVDLGRNYCHMAQWRLTDPRERARAERIVSQVDVVREEVVAEAAVPDEWAS